MSYRLNIVKITPNPKYDTPEEAERRERSLRGGAWDNDPLESYQFEQQALTVELTDEEFRAIKKAVLEAM